jgi:hypothetical protein
MQRALETWRPPRRRWWAAALGVLAVVVLAVMGARSQRARNAASGATTNTRPARGPAGDEQGFVFHSRAECEQVLGRGARLPRAEGSARLAAWNVRWFPNGSLDPNDPGQRGTDLGWLSCALVWLDADVVAVQEFRAHERGLAAMRELERQLGVRGGGRWRVELDRCSQDGGSHVGFVYDAARVTVAEGLGATSDMGCAADANRSWSRYVRFRGGLDLHLVTLHLQWGTTRAHYERRKRAHDALSEAWASAQSAGPDRDLIALGDFNTSGCSDCPNQLPSQGEVGELRRESAARRSPFRLLEAEPRCTEYERGIATAIDHALVNADLQELPAGKRLEVYGPCRALECRPGPEGSEPAEFADYFSQLSDHCPIVLTLADRDLDG